MDNDTLSTELGRRSVRTLWFSVIAPPALFLFALILNYVLVNTECHRPRIVPLAVSLLTLLLVVGGCVYAQRTRSAVGMEKDAAADTPLDRTRFIALLGAFSSAVFALLIVAQMLPSILVPECIGL